MDKGQLYSLTPEEVEIMRVSESDPNIFFEYWFEKPGVKPFQLDYGFEDKAKWQKDFCLAEQSMIVAICGIATGKTLSAGMSAFYHAAITPYFRFMNVGHELMQAKFMYDEILKWAEGTRAEQLISKAPSSPHPKIFIEYMIDDVKISSELLFQSAGEKSDAMNIFSWRGDWINIEEAGRFKNLQEIVSRLTTRLTGATPVGRPYLGRLSLISNPIDNPELWSVFDNARRNPDALTIMVDTSDNKNVTQKQIDLQLANIPKEEQDFYLTGKRPEGSGSYFNRSKVDACTSDALSVKLREGVARKEEGYVAEYYPALGNWHYEFPHEHDRQYILLGDPGTGAAPLRNAPVCMVVDVTYAPKINTIAALWWGNGGGRITPFVTQYLEFIRKYNVVFAGMDSTATQKNFAEVLNIEYIYGEGYSIDRITGMDFSGGRKHQYLVSTRLSIETGAWLWPSSAKGIVSQLKSYDPVEDVSQTSKLPQDIVATLSMAAFASRALYPPTPIPAESGKEGSTIVSKGGRGVGEARSSILRVRAGR